MGGTTFSHSAKGKTAQEAFQNAVEEARWEYGNSGYTGSIAEKHSFVMIKLPDGEEPQDYSDKLIDRQDKRKKQSHQEPHL